MLFAKTNKQKKTTSTHSQQVRSSNQGQNEGFVTPFRSISSINCKEATEEKQTLKPDAKKMT